MVESAILEVEKRTSSGTREARRMRKKGLLPGIVYGHKKETLSVTFSSETIANLVRHGVRVVDLQLGGVKDKALIRELQWDHLGKEILHVDFARVSEEE